MGSFHHQEKACSAPRVPRPLAELRAGEFPGRIDFGENGVEMGRGEGPLRFLGRPRGGDLVAGATKDPGEREPEVVAPE